MRGACNPFAVVASTDPVERFFNLYLSARGLYPFHERHLYRPSEMLIQFHMLLLLECVGSVPPSAGVVCNDLVGSSFSFTCCRCCLSVWGLYPLLWVSSVPTTRDALSTAALMREACTPFRERRLY